MVHRGVGILLLIVVLSGCFRNPSPGKLDFSTDPGIFRGTYQTEVDMRVASPDVALSANSSLLAMGNGDFFHAVQFWDITTATPLGTIDAGFSVDSVTLTRDGNHVAAVLPDYVNDRPGGVRVWEVESGEVVHKLPPNSPACPRCSVRSLALSPDETALAVLSYWSRYKHPDESVSEVGLFDMATGERLAVLRGPPHSLDVGYSELSFSPDGTRVAAIATDYYTDAHVRVWEVSSGQLLGTYTRATPSGRQSNAHMWSGDAPVLGVHYEDRLELVNSETGRTLTRLPLPPKEIDLYGLYADADHTRLMGGFGGGGLALWDLGTGELLAQVAGDKQYVAGFSPDGQYAIAYDRESRSLTLRDPDTLEPKQTLVNGAVVPLRVTANATYVDRTSYRIEGTVAFGDDAPVPYRGAVQGKETQVYLAPQMSCICTEPATLEARFTYKGRTWHLRASPEGTGDSASWYAELSETAGTAVGGWSHTVTLDRVR